MIILVKDRFSLLKQHIQPQSVQTGTLCKSKRRNLQKQAQRYKNM